LIRPMFNEESIGSLLIGSVDGIQKTANVIFPELEPPIADEVTTQELAEVAA
jgi:hypothetical protein